MTGVAVGTVQIEVDGEGSPIIFVHGLGASSNSFQMLLGGLNGYRCIRPDLPGAGRSPLPFGVLSIETFVDCIQNLAIALGAQQAHLVGHSMGSLVCQHVASRAPNLVKSLTLFGPILEPPEAARQRLKDRAQTVRQGGMISVVDAIVAGGLSSTTKASDPLAVPFVREMHMRQNSEGFAQACEALANADAADIRRIRCKTLLVTGDEDGIAPPSMAQAIADRVQGAKVKVIQRCGHWTQIERPRECSRILSEFLRSVEDT
jgi:pimeloyl-ACP methyl ester carboxylesterase